MQASAMLESILEAKRLLGQLEQIEQMTEMSAFFGCVHGPFVYYRVNAYVVDKDAAGEPVFFAIPGFGALLVHPANVPYIRRMIQESGFTPLEVETRLPPAKDTSEQSANTGGSVGEHDSADE